ncbi:haloacid dehalogenase-like hydrolase domain-containing protein At3g48420 isoform X5 [Phalaenopsis equestris]|uniref:haloacid dehalogenase-like hydrolase domain-containing protein At3g48420 isoform X5 n=1 Tax=Phalaenopsis equestris TaxID=78828 RepID=UPI0009E1C382|nr:haloacid dehalogenase-like hydrolase domain-containing protein At3g48420 isoform X5 [Phalaenopsis equestris]
MATVAPSPGVSSTAPGLRRNFRSSITSQTSPLPKRATTLFSSVLVFSGRWGGSAPIGFGSVVVCAASSFSSFSPSSLPAALLFDCDGVLVDTEKDGHRISFNETFDEMGLRVTWDVKLYGKLLKIGGGKERMTAYFNQTGWPEKAPKTEEERIAFVASLHKRKTELFMALIEKKLLPLRPGVERLIDDALTKGVKVAVCSTSNEKALPPLFSGLFLLFLFRKELSW